MLARVSRWKIKDGSYDAVMEIVNGSIRDAITGIDGLEKCIATLNRDTNEGVTIAVYRDQVAIDTAQETIGQVWGSLADHLAGPPEIEMHEVTMSVG